MQVTEISSAGLKREFEVVVPAATIADGVSARLAKTALAGLGGLACVDEKACVGKRRSEPASVCGPASIKCIKIRIT